MSPNTDFCSLNSKISNKYQRLSIVHALLEYSNTTPYYLHHYYKDIIIAIVNQFLKNIHFLIDWLYSHDCFKDTTKTCNAYLNTYTCRRDTTCTKLTGACTCTYTHRHTEPQTHTDTDRQTHRTTDTFTVTHIDSHTHTQTHRHRHAYTHTHTRTHTNINVSSISQ